MARADIPGAAYAVVGPAGVEHQGSFGVDGDGSKVTTATPFLWGSMAKPVTASLVVLLSDSGELELDEPITSYLPKFRMADKAASDQITVRHLLSQTGGIPERMDLTDRYDDDREPADVVAKLADVPMDAKTGQEHIYSSINYMLLAAVVEEVTGRSFAEVLTDRVLEPAGMDTAITSSNQSDEQLPPGHRYVVGSATPFATDYDPAGLSSGYLGGSLDDAVAFAQANLSGSRLLSDKQRTRLFHPEIRTDVDRSYDLGWRTWNVFGADKPMIWHSGAAPGYQASIVILPERDRAIVVLQNVYGNFQETQLLDTSWGLASLTYDVEPEIHNLDSLYVVVLSVIGIVCLLLLVLALYSVRRLVGPGAARAKMGRRRTGTRLAAWLLGLALVAAGLFYLPVYFGVSMGQIPLWAPDIAALVYASLALSVVLVLLRIAVFARLSRGVNTQ